MMRMILIGGFVMTLILSHNGAAMADPETTAKAAKFVAKHEAKFRTLDVIAGKAWWDANITGKDADFKNKEHAQNQIDAALADKTVFAELKLLKTAKDKGAIDDKLIARAVDVLYLLYLEKQVDPELLKKITAKANAVEQKFNVYRASVDNSEMRDSQVRDVLKNSKDTVLRKKVWEASKGVGASVEADLKELVKLRNQAAKELGFKNYHVMMLFLNEQDGPELVRILERPYNKCNSLCLRL